MTTWQTFIQSAGNYLDGTFLAPLFLAFLGLIPIVVILYFLKLRRTEVVISSTLLWLRSVQDLTANALFQRLRRNLLLLLQILILLAVVLAMARPFVRAEGTAGKRLCLLIDRSASMNTVEGDTTRLELAKAKALDLVNEMQKGDKAMIVAFAENADVLCELTDDRGRLRRAIRDIAPSHTQTKLRDAMLVVRSLKLTVPDLHVAVISDGNVSDLDRIRTRTFDLSYVRIGETDANAGIVAFSAREPVPGQGDERQTFVLVHNAGDAPVSTTLTLAFNDEVMAVEEVEVPPKADQEVLFGHSLLGEGILEVTLDHPDALAVDNVARLALRPPATLRVLLVADPSATSAYFLKRALLPDPRVDLSSIAPADFTDSAGYDLVLFDSFAPEQLPAGTLVFINAIPPMDGVGTEGEIEHPPVIAIASDHPMMRFNLNPSNVRIAKAQRLVVPNDARGLVSTTGAPLIADVSRGAQQILVIGFDIADSDWPLHLSYPLFFQNLLAWVPRMALAAQTSIDAGHPLTIIPDPAYETATVTRPDGRTDDVALDPLRSVFYADTEQTGVYTIACGPTTRAYAVNVLDKTESAIGSAAALAIGQGEYTAQQGSIRQNRESWRWFVAAGVLILLLEWAIYCRRAWF